MRVVVVSAHYPPNFVSGGTLAPQRMARALRARGHDVSVYAGWLGEREPLETWRDVDETGLPVRWIVTSPWTAWDDTRNFDNPAVTSDFAAHLRDLRPDVVHVHALQSVGSGVVEAAAAAGASVVVTMHDFWWVCARQFLVDRSFDQCCPVVACGSCRCSVDRPWLDARTAVQVDRLRHVDAVLAVSQIEADILVANGVDPAKLRVDENGVPVDATTAVSPTDGHARRPDHVRFTYAGGPNPMKGVHVVLEAASRLGSRRGWSLTAYGIERTQEFIDISSIDLAGVPLERAPAFDHAALDEVLAETDVLLLPSLSETYSLLTREALSRGVPVLASACYGPEEVVEHGVNGLIVPAGDATALAEAMGRFLDDPTLLDRLRRGCHLERVRSVEEQAAGLDALYRELASRRPPRVAAQRQVRRALFVVGIQGAPLRYRAQLPAEALDLVGVNADVRHYRDPSLPSLAERADAIVVYRVPATVQIATILRAARERGTPLFFDVDDLIFDPDLLGEISALASLSDAERDLYAQGVHRYRTTMELCDAFVGSTQSLCRHAEEVTGLPAHRFANGVGTVLGRASDEARRRPRMPGPLRVGYMSGTTTHDQDWLFVEPTIARMLDERPEVELWLGGLVNPGPALDRFGDRIRRLPFMLWTELPGALRDLDVNLAPLEPGSRFNEAKSAIKWLEAALVGTPTIATPTEPFREAIDHRHNGWLADHPDEWAEGIATLLDDALLRARLGGQARRDALLRWSPHLQGRRYLDILERGALRHGSWAARAEPVLLDEPYEPTALDAYPPAPPAPPPEEAAPPLPTRTRMERGRDLADRGRRVLREEGPLVAGRRAAAFAHRRWPTLGRRVRGRS